ncbi:MAG: hypothetical protein COT84_02020 [Chlamydiae bacterium CG10_big_fil_rev_8_21_14_0_10_35_9]|nr:MAG: hypothetical protein COT84_02020 [Chlamydiae bacterium CG10_big_fil_rev_8_21_14_0_10_35_9]
MMTDTYRKEFEMKTAQRYGLPYMGYTRSDIEAIKLIRSVLDNNTLINYEFGWDCESKKYICRVFRPSNKTIYNFANESLAMVICECIDSCIKKGLM